eukprot:6655748-Alexandrium_andersonii.AAC.2
MSDFTKWRPAAAGKATTWDLDGAVWTILSTANPPCPVSRSTSAASTGLGGPEGEGDGERGAHPEGEGDGERGAPRGVAFGSASRG